MHAEIEAINNAIEFVHLRKRSLELSGRGDNYPARQLLVIEQCGLTDARRGRFDREIKSNPINLNFIDPLDEYGIARLYIDLAAVTFGDTPSLIEFIAMPTAESTQWLTGAYEVNPAMFAWINEMAVELAQFDKKIFEGLTKTQSTQTPDETLKKNKRKRRRSSSG